MSGAEAMLWQNIVSYEALMRLLTNDLPRGHRKPGSYMVDALKYRDQWQSRLLRTSARFAALLTQRAAFCGAGASTTPPT